MGCKGPFCPIPSVLKRENLYGSRKQERVTGHGPSPAAVARDVLAEAVGPALFSRSDGPLIGLKVDARTNFGLRRGIPAILDILRETGFKATFYLPFGIDRSGLIPFYGLHHPAQLLSAVKAGSHKGYDARTLLSGTFLPARPLARAFPNLIARIKEEGHEIGIGPWDPSAWRFGGTGLSEATAALQIGRSAEAFRELLGSEPATSAAPGWLCSDESLLFQQKTGLLYSSDCRGYEPFIPFVEARPLKTPQVPTTLPTVEEAPTSGSAESPHAFYADLGKAALEQEWPVFNARAEVEGDRFVAEFSNGLKALADSGARIVPLRQVLAARLAEDEEQLPVCTMAYGLVDGRPVSVSMQLFNV